MPRVLLLMPSTTYRATDFLAAAHGMNVEVVVGTDIRQILAADAPASNLALNFLDPAEATRQVITFAEDHALDAVVGVDDTTAFLAALAADALGLPANPPDAVQAAGDKALARAVLHRAGLPGPQFQVLPVDTDPAGASGSVPYPCVLKPTFLSASRGVIRVDNPESFVAAFRRIAALIEQPKLKARGGARARDILVESFVPGCEYALEGLLIAGKLETLALFDKPDPLDGPYFEETLYITPSRLPDEVQARITATVQRGVDALGLREGPVHAEVRAERKPDGEIQILEIAARSIGGLCSRMLRFGTGLSLETIILQHALGLRTVVPARESGATGALMLPIPGAGVLRQVDGIDAARSSPGIVEVDITIPLGQEVVPLPDGDRYLGFLFARSATPEEVEQALRHAGSLLRFTIS